VKRSSYAQETNSEGIKQSHICLRRGGDGGAAHGEVRPGKEWRSRCTERICPEPAKARRLLRVILRRNALCSMLPVLAFSKTANLRVQGQEFAQYSWMAQGEFNMHSDGWIKTLKDGRRVKFTNEEVLDDGSFITAQIESNEVVYSVLLSKEIDPLSRQEVERRFQNELSKK
jgi:hypothetical protein